MCHLQPPWIQAARVSRYYQILKCVDVIIIYCSSLAPPGPSVCEFPEEAFTDSIDDVLGDAPPLDFIWDL
jgi:hypothetical protein